MRFDVKLKPKQRISAEIKRFKRLSAELGNVNITSEGYIPPTYEGATIVTPTKASQTLETDGYFVKADIKVNPIPNEYIVPEGVKEITKNGTYDITDKKTAEVNVPIPEGYYDASGISTDPSKVLVGNEYVNAFGKQVGTMPNNNRIQTTLSYEKASEVIIPEGYHPEGYVRVDFQDKTVTPTKSTQSVTPGKGLTLGRVTVNPIPDQYIIPNGTKEITENGEHDVNEFQKVNIQVEAEIPEGYVELPTLTNEGTAADMLMGKELIDSKGQVVSGLIPIKTAGDLTASGATVTVPPGCYEDTVSKSVATATQATPSISVSTAGKITASATQSAGYVSSGTKSATKQLTTQAAKTVTPTKSSQTAVASQRYTTGAITVAPIPDEYIIPSGTKAITENGTHDVTEFSEVNVSIEGKEDLNAVLDSQTALIEELKTELQGKASGGGDGLAREIVNKTVTAFNDNEITTVGQYAFVGCTEMTNANVPAATSIGQYAFSSCTALKTVRAAEITSLGNYALNGCSVLDSIYAPKLKTLGQYAFQNCAALEEFNGENVTSVGTYAFSGCNALASLNLPKATSVGGYAFNACAASHISLPSLASMTSGAFRGSKFVTVDLPIVTNIANNGFRAQGYIKRAVFPKATSTSSEAMRNCTALEFIDMHVVTSLGTYTWYDCTKLETLIIRTTSKVCPLSNVNVLTNTKISNGEGYIYVPAAFKDQYASATNWSTYAAQFRSIEDYPEICGG